MLAVQSYCRIETSVLPCGKIDEVILSDKGGVKLHVIVGMLYGNTVQPVTIEVKESDVIELLIRACLEQNIPVPRRAKKSISLMDGDLALVIEMESQDGG